MNTCEAGRGGGVMETAFPNGLSEKIFLKKNFRGDTWVNKTASHLEKHVREYYSERRPFLT